MQELDGGQFTDIDSYLLGALTLSTLSGEPFVMSDVGRVATARGLTPFHLAACRTLGSLCGAEVEGDAVSAKELRFRPRHAPRARDFTVDIGAVTGRPSPEPVTPLIEALIPVLARAEGESLLRFRGTNVAPNRPSAFWLREALLPMLGGLGIEAAIEIERWGWYPDGGGDTTLLVEGGWKPSKQTGSLEWEERGDLVGLWALIALSPRMEPRLGIQMRERLEREWETEPFRHPQFEIRHVPSPGPGSGIFLALQCEHVTAGFEALAHQGMGGEQVVEGVAAALDHFFWNDNAFETELARAMMIPLALCGRPASFTTTEATLPLRILEFLLPRFLPVSVSIASERSGVKVAIQPN